MIHFPAVSVIPSKVGNTEIASSLKSYVTLQKDTQNTLQLSSVHGRITFRRMID